MLFFAIKSQAPLPLPLILRTEGVCVRMRVRVFMHVWAWLSDLPAVLFLFVYDWCCWCQPSSNPSPSSHKPELIGHSTHFLLRIWSVAQRLIHTDSDKATEQCGTISHADTHTHTGLCLDIFTVLTYAKTEMHPTALHQPCLDLRV